MNSESLGDARSDPLVGFYSESGDLEIEGNAIALHRLVRGLRAGRSTIELEPGEGARSDPYDGFLERLVVEPAAGSVRVSRNSTVLTVAGSPEALALFADNVESLIDQGDGHLHEEYYPDHFYLAPDSAPLVVDLIPSNHP